MSWKKSTTFTLVRWLGLPASFSGVTSDWRLNRKKSQEIEPFGWVCLDWVRRFFVRSIAILWSGTALFLQYFLSQSADRAFTAVALFPVAGRKCFNVLLLRIRTRFVFIYYFILNILIIPTHCTCTYLLFLLVLCSLLRCFEVVVSSLLLLLFMFHFNVSWLECVST